MKSSLAVPLVDHSAGSWQTASDAIDRAHLARYTMGDAALEREILELFVNHLPGTIRDLGLAASDRDWHMAAHALKGSARAVGAWRLARSAEQAEKLALADADATHEALSHISAAAAETCACANRIIAGL